MKISLDEVRRIAALAALEFDETGEASMAGSMSRILDYVDQIREAGVAAASRELPAAALELRDDVPLESLAPEVVSDAAPAFSRGHFVVPKVIGGE